MRSHSPLSRKLFALDLLLAALGFHLGNVLRQVLPYGNPLKEASAHPPFLVYLMVVAGWAAALRVHGVYEPERVLRWYKETSKIAVASLMATILLAGGIYLTHTELSRIQFGYGLIINLVLLLGCRYIVRTWHRLFGFNGRNAAVRILLIGGGTLGAHTGAVLDQYRRWGYQLIGFLDDNPEKSESPTIGAPYLGAVDDIERIVSQWRIDDVWIALPVRSHEKVRDLVERIAALPLRLHIVPDYFPLALVSARPRNFGGLPVIALRDPVITGMPRIVKRAFDIAISLGALVLTAPLIALVALLIRLDSAGPIILRQERVGENGRIFRMFKFRTMTATAEVFEKQFKNETRLSAINHKNHLDPRVTRVGRLLRRYSLDELPQLCNVLLGDMSLVGPRPELPWLVAKYDLWQLRRLAVPQGMTGWWQVSGRSGKPMHLNTDQDLYYVYNYSLWLDLRILAKTVKVVLQGDGAF